MRQPWRLLAAATALCSVVLPGGRHGGGAEALTLSRAASGQKEKHGSAAGTHKRRQLRKHKNALSRHRRNQPLSLAQTSVTSQNISLKDVDVYYTAEMLDKLKVVTEQRRLAGEKRFNAEHDRLAAALSRASNPGDQQLLNESLAKVEEFRQEEETAVDRMYQFYYTTKAALGARGADAPKCDYLVCGQNAACHVLPMNQGARCKCNNCFKGDGFVCKPSLCGAGGGSDTFLGAQPLVQFRKDVAKPNFQDIHATAFGDNFVAVVFRDSKQGDRGFVKVGHVGPGMVKWSALQAFSGDMSAFGPTVQGLSNGRLLISFRDMDIDGEGYFVGGEFLGDLQAFTNTSLRSPQPFSKKQAHKVALVPLATSRVVCLYAGRAPLGPDSPSEEAFGAAMLVQVLQQGTISILGKYHFANDLRVARLSATALSPTSLVVAYRGLPPTDEEVQPGATSKELSLAWIGMRDEELIVEQSNLKLEPEKTEMWSRDVAVISAQLFSYAYYSSTERKTKLAVIHMDPETHHFTLTNTPTIVGVGVANWVQAPAIVSGMGTPRALVTFQEPHRRVSAEVCKIGSDGKVMACSKAGWADAEVKISSSTRLKDGRIFLAYADTAGDGYYQAFGAQEFAVA